MAWSVRMGWGIMAAKSPRRKGTLRAARAGKKRVVKKPAPKKRAAKKAVARPAVGKPRAARSPSEAGIVEAALAAFAHEVRTPLTGILAISSLLATSELGERELRWVDTIKVGAEHLAALATLFVDAARSGTTGLAIRQDFFDLRTLATAVGDSLAGRAAAKGLQPQIEIADDLPVFAVGDPVRLRAALENLIDNAVKFTPQGKVAFAVSAMPGRKKREIKVAFAVSDSGIGLSLAEIKRLFKPFSQANVSIASRFGGAGLGLSSVRQLARAMGGDITASQQDSGGMTFKLTVTLQQAGELDTVATGSDAPPRLPQGLRVLSIEDNPFGRVVLNAILTELGHQAEFIGRGEAAPEKIVQGGFDAVLMDMVLPGIDGVETIRRIRAMEGVSGRIAIIGVSGRTEDEQASRSAGADAFLSKPVSPRALATALLEATRR